MLFSRLAENCPFASVILVSELTCTGAPATGVFEINNVKVMSVTGGVGVTVGVGVGVLVIVGVGLTVGVLVTVGVGVSV